MIRVVVFDFDGTLVDSNTIKERTFHEVVAGLPGGPAAMAIAMEAGGDRYRIFGEVSQRIEPDAAQRPALARRLAAEYSRRCLRAIAAAPERRGAGRALAELRRQGVALYINTATPSADIPALLRARRWERMFSGVFGAPLDKVTILHAIQRKERVTSHEMVMVGDSRDDVEAAQEVGVWFFGITSEGRINVPPPFGMHDLVKLPAVFARLQRCLPLA